ncbi:hypothetical protein V8D89_013677 [Ganoderma adspersum]
MAAMRQADAVLGGSAALYFFVSTPSTVRNFNIFVPFRTAATIIHHLLNQQGYDFVSSFSAYRAPLDSMNYCIDNPLNYLSGVREVSHLDHDGMSVDVIASGIGAAIDCATVPLACQWTTLLMGYVAVNGFRPLPPALPALLDVSFRRLERMLDILHDLPAPPAYFEIPLALHAIKPGEQLGQRVLVRAHRRVLLLRVSRGRGWDFDRTL